MPMQQPLHRLLKHLTRPFVALLLVGCMHTPSQVATQDRTGLLLPDGQRINAAGDLVVFGGRPVDVVVGPDGRFLYAKDNRGIVVIDATTWEVVQELPFGKDRGGSQHGIALDGAGTRLYATTAQRHLMIGTIADDGTLSWQHTVELPGPKGTDASHPTGIALTPNGTHAWVALSRNNALAKIDLTTHSVEATIPTGIAPYDVVLSPDGATAWVSNWGGRRPTAEDHTADSSGTEVVVDDRGIGASGTVSAIDLASGETIAEITTGLHPTDLLLNRNGSRLFVANANSDTVSVMNTTTHTVLQELLVRPDPKLPFGSAPNGLALNADESRLFVANGGNNAIAVVALEDPNAYRVTGFLPTAWYPAGLAWHDGNLYVANVKGLGSRKDKPENDGRSVYDFLGTINRIPESALDQLDRHTAAVHRQGNTPQVLTAWERSHRTTNPVPVPENLGEASVFDHVVYIVKENRTYDQVLGELPQGNGDPSLCLYGRDVAPNHYALAEEFVLLDNFYCNGVNSADGHAWVTEGNVTDYLEKSFGGFTRSYTWGDDALSYSSSGFIWDNVLAHGLSFRNYGEMDYAETVPAEATFTEVYENFKTGGEAVTFKQKIGIERLQQFTAPDFPGWNMRIPDVLRAERFLAELDDFSEQGTFPNMTLIYLPQDHTSGTKPGQPTPEAHMADNDLALGQIIEGLSKSPFWPKMCIFVIEDDPQNGFDHVDGHRSICFVVSPYTRRQSVVSHFYNQTSVLHTMARMLAIPPLNQRDAMSPLMGDCFTLKPDLTPYIARPNTIPLDQLNPELTSLADEEKRWALASLAQDLTHVDAADEDTFNRIIWHAIKGVGTPYPADFAGAHGKGLGDLNLVIDPDAEEDGD